MTAVEEEQKKQAGCAGAAFMIDLFDVKPTYYMDLNQVRLVVINKGDRDLNEFWVNSSYGDSTSDRNLNKVDIEEGGMGVVWTKGTSTPIKPVRIVIESKDCGGVIAEISSDEIEG